MRNRADRRQAARYALAYGASVTRAAKITGLPVRTVKAIGRGIFKGLSADFSLFIQQRGLRFR